MWLVGRRNVSFQSFGIAPRTYEVLNSPKNSNYFGLEEPILWSSLVQLPFGSACILTGIPARGVQHWLGRASEAASCLQLHWWRGLGGPPPKSSTHCSRGTCLGFMVWKILTISTFYLAHFEFLERKKCLLPHWLKICFPSERGAMRCGQLGF